MQIILRPYFSGLIYTPSLYGHYMYAGPPNKGGVGWHAMSSLGTIDMSGMELSGDLVYGFFRWVFLFWAWGVRRTIRLSQWRHCVARGPRNMRFCWRHVSCILCAYFNVICVADVIFLTVPRAIFVRHRNLNFFEKNWSSTSKLSGKRQNLNTEQKFNTLKLLL